MGTRRAKAAAAAQRAARLNANADEQTMIAIIRLNKASHPIVKETLILNGMWDEDAADNVNIAGAVRRGNYRSTNQPAPPSSSTTITSARSLPPPRGAAAAAAAVGGGTASGVPGAPEPQVSGKIKFTKMPAEWQDLPQGKLGEIMIAYDEQAMKGRLDLVSKSRELGGLSTKLIFQQVHEHNTGYVASSPIPKEANGDLNTDTLVKGCTTLNRKHGRASSYGVLLPRCCRVTLSQTGMVAPTEAARPHLV
jgi:hypothetical protein